jgi:hypothetical protein
VDRTASRSLPRPERFWAAPPDLTTAIRCARKGDEDAFGVLYRDIQPRMLRYLRTLVGADAEDVASETWLNVARDLGQFEGDSAPPNCAARSLGVPRRQSTTRRRPRTRP